MRTRHFTGRRAGGNSLQVRIPLHHHNSRVENGNAFFTTGKAIFYFGGIYESPEIINGTDSHNTVTPPLHARTGDESAQRHNWYDDDTADTYTKDTDLTYLGELLDELHDKGELELDCAGSDFGRQVKVIGGLQDDISEYSEWIGIYSDITDETLLFTEYKMTYGDKEYTSVNCGIDLLPLYDGRTYLFIMCESE